MEAYACGAAVWPWAEANEGLISGVALISALLATVVSLWFEWSASRRRTRRRVKALVAAADEVIQSALCFIDELEPAKNRGGADPDDATLAASRERLSAIVDVLDTLSRSDGASTSEMIAISEAKSACGFALEAFKRSSSGHLTELQPSQLTVWRHALENARSVIRKGACRS